MNPSFKLVRIANLLKKSSNILIWYIYGIYTRAETGSKFWTQVLDRCYPPQTRVFYSMTTLPSRIYYPRNTHAIVEKVKHEQTAVVISLIHSVNEIGQITVNVMYLFHRIGRTIHGGYDDVML